MNNVVIIDLEKYDKMNKTINSQEEEINILKFRAFDYNNELESFKEEYQILEDKYKKLLNTIVANEVVYEKAYSFNVDVNAIVKLLNEEYFKTLKEISEIKRGEKNE